MHLRPCIGNPQDKKEHHQIFNAWCGVSPATRYPVLQNMVLSSLLLIYLKEKLTVRAGAIL